MVRIRRPLAHGVVALPRMAKAEASGTVTAFRHSKFKQDSYQTIVERAKPEQAAELLGAGPCGSARTAARFRAGSSPLTARGARSTSGGTAAFRRRLAGRGSGSFVDAKRNA
jgi:hypothetical protein